MEDYCGVRFSTIFKSRHVENPKLQELINWCRQFKASGFTPEYEGGSCGNLSFRTIGGFIITCSQADFSIITPEDLTEVMFADINKKEIRVKGKKAPSSESFMHNEIYRRRMDVNAIFHGHSDEFLKFSQKMNLPITQNEQPSGSIELMQEVVKILGKHNFILLKNHGFLSLGDSMGTAGNLAVKRFTQMQRIKRLAQ
jgi:ribulose-5-phosphate 4-epimerase/fuculose-1-phosphate aldolase